MSTVDDYLRARGPVLPAGELEGERLLSEYDDASADWHRYVSPDQQCLPVARVAADRMRELRVEIFRRLCL